MLNGTIFAALSLVCMLASILYILFDKSGSHRIPTLISVIGSIFYGVFLCCMDIATNQEYLFPLFAFAFCTFVANEKYKMMKREMVKEKLDVFKSEYSKALKADVQVNK